MPDAATDYLLFLLGKAQFTPPDPEEQNAKDQ
jgi:hypothetical protein